MNMRFQDALTARRKQLAEGEGQKGFTLIELLVVVIIIGILAAIAIPVFLNLREGAWKSSVESDLKNVALAVESFTIENNGSLTTFPATAVLGPDATDVVAELPGAKASAGNTITITKDGNAYVIVGTNANLSTISLTYDSAKGGLGEWK